MKYKFSQCVHRFCLHSTALVHFVLFAPRYLVLIRDNIKCNDIKAMMTTAGGVPLLLIPCIYIFLACFSAFHSS